VAKLVSFDIPVTEDISTKKVSKKVKTKTVGVLLIRTKGKANTGIQIYQAKTMPAVMSDVSDFPDGWKALYDIEFYFSAEPELLKYPIKRKVQRGKFRFFPIEDEFVKRIKAAGKSLGALE
jgi:hypothetical protein